MAQYSESLRASVIKMLVDLGLDVTYQRFTNDNIMIRCPFAKVSGHSSGYDSNPSFGIKITNRGFLYNCFTCSRKGRSLIQLAKQLVEEGVLKSASNMYDVQNSVAMLFPEYYTKHIDNPRKVALTRLKSFSNTHREFIEYNKMRGLDEFDIRIARLRYDKEVQQVIFPCFNYEDHLVGTVRKSITGEWPKFTNDFDTGGHLYLEWLIKSKTGIIVEGMYDALLTYHHLRKLELLNTFSVVGVYGANVTNTQMKLIVSYFDTIILMGDHDTAGIGMERKIYFGLKKRLPHIYRLRYVGKDPGEIMSTDKFSFYINKWLKPFNTIN